MKFQEKSPEERALAHWNATDRNWNFRRRMTMAHIKLGKVEVAPVDRNTHRMMLQFINQARCHEDG